MMLVRFDFLHSHFRNCQQFLSRCLLLVICLLLVNMHPAIAGINDDNYEGNIYVLYAGNGSMVPPKSTLAQSFDNHKPVVVVFYVDDSSDCKQYASVVSRFQEFYGRATEIMPINVDSITSPTYTSREVGYYYKGYVPQVVVFNQAGEVVLNEKGQVPYEKVDDSLRKVFGLLPREVSTQLKRRPINEFSGELTQ